LSSSDLGIEMKEELNKNLNVLDLLELNSAFRKLSAVQKRHLESLAEGPVSFIPGERLWRAGTAVDKAFIVVAGTVSFIIGRRNAGSVSWSNDSNLRGDRSSKGLNRSLGESMRIDAIKAVKELSGSEFAGTTVTEKTCDRSQIQLDSVFGLSNTGDSISDEHVVKASLTDAHDFSAENGLDLDNDDPDVAPDDVRRNASESPRPSLSRRRSSRARFANKVLGRMYSRRALTEGLVFSKGHFLGDVSKMVSGKLLRTDMGGEENYNGGTLEQSASLNTNLLNTAIEEEDSSDSESIVHSSTLTAGKDGCVVLYFPKSNLIPFLDEYPGVLLSLLGTQVIV
jgi:CRP-like cAMP-binding protein